MSYDNKCHILAAAFLADCEIQDEQRRAQLTAELAQQIQVTIDEFVGYDVGMPTVKINGEPHRLGRTQLAYEEIVRLAGMTGRPTVIWAHTPSCSSASLIPGKSVRAREGMNIDCVHTDNA